MATVSDRCNCFSLPYCDEFHSKRHACNDTRGLGRFKIRSKTRFCIRSSCDTSEQCRTWSWLVEFVPNLRVGTVALVASQISVHDVNGNLSMNRLAFSALWSVPIFSLIVSLSIIDSSMSALEFGLYLVNGLLFDVLHFLGNLFFAMWFGQWFDRLLQMNQPNSELIQQESEHVSTF